MNDTTHTLPACVLPGEPQEWDFFVAENAPTPHCGITLNGSNFICSPLDQGEQIEYICEALKRQHLAVDPFAEKVRAALRECMGFVEAWACHLDDIKEPKSAATVNGVLASARSVYLKSDWVAQGFPISDFSGRTEKSILGHILLETLEGWPDDVGGHVPYEWLKDNASYCSNPGKTVCGELIINLARTFSDVPDQLAEIFSQARGAGYSYLEFSLS